MAAVIWMLFALATLTACAGQVNLYAQPVADFDAAVSDTARAIETFAALKRRQTFAADVADQASAQTPLMLSGCSEADLRCAIVTPDGKTAIGQDDATMSAVRDTLSKVQAYAQALVKITGLNDPKAMAQRQLQSDQAYRDLLTGVKALTGATFDASADDVSDALESGLGEAYLDSKRTKLLHTLVQAGDPVVEAACDELAELLSGQRSDYILAQKLAVQTQLDTYGQLGQKPLADANATQALRSQALSRAGVEAGYLRTMIQADPSAALKALKKAHGELRAALTVADGDLGKAQAALEGFGAVSQKLDATMAQVRGLP